MKKIYHLYIFLRLDFVWQSHLKDTKVKKKNKKKEKKKKH